MFRTRGSPVVVVSAILLAIGALGAAQLGVAGRSAAPGTAKPFATTNALTVLQAQFPLQLIVRGDRVQVDYRARNGPAATGTLFVRNDREQAFTAVPLRSRRVASKEVLTSLSAVVPDRLIQGRKLLYYAVITDPATGTSVTVPAGGGAAPESAWIVNDAFRVDLDKHAFRRPKAPEAIVARARPGEVGFRRNGLLFGPTSFDVAKDRSVWLWDSVNKRVLGWAPGRPNTVARTVRLPYRPDDFAAGPADSLYLLLPPAIGTPSGRLIRLSAAGKVLWASRTHRASGLATGPGGTLYWTGGPAEESEEEMAHASSGINPWMPVATPAGRPLSPAAQARGIRRTEPLPGGMGLVRVSAARDRNDNPHEARVALIDRAGRLVRAWRVRSKAVVWLYGQSTLVGGDPVIELTTSEYVVLRLAPRGGLRARLALPKDDPPRSAYGERGFAPDIRVTPDGNVYQLGSAPGFGAAIYRYSLQPTR